MKRHSNPRSAPRLKLTVESLESRRLMAADLVVFQNPIAPLDVNLDQHVSPVDALAIINELNIPTENQLQVGGFLDTSGDDILAPVDALGIINALNSTTDTNEMDHLVLARDYLVNELDSIPQDAKPVTHKFNSLITDYESATKTIYESLQSFQEYAVENTAELKAYYSKLEQATIVNTDALQRGLFSIASEIKAVSTNSFGNVPDQPGVDDETPYEFDPTQYTDPSLALPELFQELEQGLDDVEIPEYGDVLDNYDEIYQTYEESDYEIDVFVTESLDISQYEDFVLHGGNLGDLLDTLEQNTDEGITNVEDLLEEEFGTTLELDTLFDDLLGAAYVGELIYNDIVAIGGETTGSVVVLSDQSVVEVDFGTSNLLHELATKYDNQVVILEGASTIVEGTEIPARTVVEVRSIFGGTELDSLKSALNTLDPLDLTGLQPILDSLNLG